MKKMVLSNENRQFFKLVADIPAINPFSPSRAAIDEEISGIHEVVDRHQRVLYAAEAIRQRLALLDTKGVRQFQDFDDRDRELMRYTFLFDVYHSCTDLFDAFIAKQEASGKTPLKVPFARKAIELLALYADNFEKITNHFPAEPMPRSTGYGSRLGCNMLMDAFVMPNFLRGYNLIAASPLLKAADRF